MSTAALVDAAEIGRLRARCETLDQQRKQWRRRANQLRTALEEIAAVPDAGAVVVAIAEKAIDSGQVPDLPEAGAET